MNICKKTLEFFHLLYLRPPRHFHLSPPPHAPPLPPPPSSSLCRTELVPPSPSSLRYSTPRTRARPRAPRGLGPTSPPPRPRSRSRRPRRDSEQIRAAGEDRWRAGPAPRHAALGTPLLRPLDPRAAAELRPPPPTRARRSPKILTPPRTRARRRALQQTRPAAVTPSSPRCCCPKPPRSRAPRAAMAWSSSRRLGLAPGRATPSCSRRCGSALSCAAVDAHPPPRPRAPRAVAVRSPRGLKLLAPPWT